ncbi:asparagine synthase (glutamine-hydrolyzing) [Streptomyces sp. NPDC059578]|uniref:asparagine synthase (glutamine-hydrolyzing) n=1 Tax=unclassified Streptomyces TaxID=2593676 RepID=UPI003654574C
MCGIAGWVDLAGLGPDARAIAEKMNDAQVHRGPDGSGVWLSRQAVIAHRRLSVIDIENGEQPMLFPPSGPEARFALSYNGELYNHRELRVELAARGHRFRTSSDTEVVLAAWVEWGARAVEHFNGIFAFAIWDDREEKLWLVRDHLGVKPLHYHRDGDRLIFGSEAKAILAHPDVVTSVDEDGLRQLVLPLLKFPGTNPYRGISEVLPGQVLEFSRYGVRTIRYWDVRDFIGRPAQADDLDSAVEGLRTLLHDAVARQTIADVPLCTFLSGGLDSSAVTAIANGLPGRTSPVSSFSVDFTDVADSTDSRSALDRRYAREAADHIGSRHSNIVLDSHLLASGAVRDATVRARDLPNGFGDLDTSLLLLCRAVREHATVALSGEAADEILGGYLWFQEPRAVEAQTFPWMADSPAHGYLHQRVLSTIDPGLARQLRLDEYLRDEYATAIGGLTFDPSISARERRHREIIHLAITYFLPMLLDRTDRLSMAGGLEVRVPFCDHRIVEHLVTLSRHVHNAGGREKGVLRDAVADLLPPGVLERRKSPYPTTPDPDYSRQLDRQLTEVLADPPDGLADIFAPHVLTPGGLTDAARSHGLVSNFEGEVVLNFASWLRQYAPKLAI